MMDEGAFSGGNGPPPYMADIWQFPVNGGGGQSVGESGVGMEGVSMGHFGNGDERNHVVSVMNDDRMSLCGVGDGGVGRKRLSEMEGKEARKDVSTSNDNGNGKCLNDSDVKRLKTPGPGGEEKSDSKAEAEPSSGKPVDQKAQNPEPPKDYIHVRARRGQATDSHSLAERARREKISERMKILQDLVPGCNKVIGKALVLDEIINYIQSLQRQVEFLSMKLEAVNSRMNPAFDIFPQKDFGQQAFDADVMPFSSQPPREYSRGSTPEWLHMQVGGNFERTN